ncbi:2-hydroxyisocaproyl-CoA dehydratase activator [subsurface metagenome]
MVLGIDIGSCYTKGVLFDGSIKNKIVIKTFFKPRQAIEKITSQLTGFDRIAATGYGRELVTDADVIITEITAFARGATYVNSSINSIIDLGGQDSKIIKIRDGKVDRFIMNDRCAAGTGNFVEKIAQALGLRLEEFGNFALNSNKPEMIDSLCVVMAETEILSLVSEGKRLEDIVAGVCDALVRRITGLGAQIGIEEPILFCGGGALNPGLVKSMKRIFGDLIIPDIPQFIGALGAALSI